MTRELLAWPPGSGADWRLRVSVAEIERDGPFSAFAGVQRCFTVLEGAGVVLGFEDGDRVLTPDSLPLAFEGGAAPSCRLIEGPTRDLNLMTRHAAGRATLRPAAAGEMAPAQALWWGLYAASPVTLSGTRGAFGLAAHSLAWTEAGEPAWRIDAAGGAPLRAWWLELARHA